MSNEQKKKGSAPSWDHLHRPSRAPKGPEKPWSPDAETSAEEFVEFLKDSGSKKAVKEFLYETYKKYEQEKFEQLKSRMENEKEVNERGSQPFHKPGNLEPAAHEELSMFETEAAFVRGLRSTKESLQRSVEDRVEEINRLLSNVGGFSAQIKSSFARSTVVFLEQEDPRYSFRERLIFSINLPNYELKRPWEKEGKGSPSSRGDGRTSLQATWDDAINSLARTVEMAGLRPKYCKNDRHYGRFVMKQDLRSSANLPDEYFSFTLDYNTQEKIDDMCVPYERIVKDYEKKIQKLGKKVDRYPVDCKTPRYLALKKKYLALVQERDYFVATTPDPNQLDEGLLFLIEVSTLKDYHVVKDRMQSIMTRYILYLSKIAAKDAEFDPELEYQMWKAGGKAPGEGKGDAEVITTADLEGLPQYTIDTSLLKRVPPPPNEEMKKAAAPAPGKKPPSSRKKAA